MSNLLAFHIIAFVCWFAGLLYSGRLLIYALEAQALPEEQRRILQQQYALMKKRLWFGITTPAMLATVGLGLALMHKTATFHQPWFMLKIIALIALLIYHFTNQWLIKQQAKNIFRGTSSRLRMFNEVGTALLIFIVLLAKHKQVLPALTSTAIALVAIALLFTLIKRLRQRSQNTN
ncbi:MAG: CopD family protein [Pseudomonadota bacterium]|nr:CopD family protein [Pseudomonadota bacterium]